MNRWRAISWAFMKMCLEFYGLNWINYDLIWLDKLYKTLLTKDLANTNAIWLKKHTNTHTCADGWWLADFRWNQHEFKHIIKIESNPNVLGLLHVDLIKIYGLSFSVCEDPMSWCARIHFDTIGYFCFAICGRYK